MTGTRGASQEVEMTKRVCRRDTSARSFILKCLALEQFPDHIFSSCHQAAVIYTAEHESLSTKLSFQLVAGIGGRTPSNCCHGMLTGFSLTPLRRRKMLPP